MLLISPPLMVNVPLATYTPPPLLAVLPLMFPPLMVNVPELTLTPPPPLLLESTVLPIIFEPVSMTKVPTFTVTSASVLPLRPCKVTLFPKVSVTPLSTIKNEPLELKLIVRSVDPPLRVMLTFFPL